MNQPAKLKSMLSILLKQDFVKFCIVGGLGFLINLMLLSLLFRGLHLPIILAQLIGAETAYLSNFFFHNSWTYQQRSDKSMGQLLVQFHMSAWAGLLLSTLIVYLMVDVFYQNYIEGLVVSSVIVLFWNFFWTKFYIWRNQRTADIAIEPQPLK